MAPRKGKALPPEQWSVYGDIIQETEDAILLNVDGEAHWLPKSEADYTGRRGDVGVEVTIPDWLAKDKGLEDGDGYAAPQPAIPEAEQKSPASDEEITFYGMICPVDDERVTLVIPNEGGTKRGGRSVVIAREEIINYGRGEEDGTDYVTMRRAYALELELELVETPPPADLAEPEPAPVDAKERPVLRQHPGLEWLGEETITVNHALTDKEKAEYAEELAELDGEIKDLEDERKALGNSINAKKKQCDKIAQRIREGADEEEVLCDKCADYSTGEMKWADAYTGTILNTRPLTAEERQMPLPGVYKLTAEANAGAPDEAADELAAEAQAEAPAENPEQDNGLFAAEAQAPDEPPATADAAA